MYNALTNVAAQKPTDIDEEVEEMGDDHCEHKLYAELAEWWPLLSPPEEYDDEAAFFLATLVGALPAPRPPRRPTLVELVVEVWSAAIGVHFLSSLTLLDGLKPPNSSRYPAISPLMNNSKNGLRKQVIHKWVTVFSTPTQARRGLPKPLKRIIGSSNENRNDSNQPTACLAVDPARLRLRHDAGRCSACFVLDENIQHPHIFKMKTTLTILCLLPVVLLMGCVLVPVPSDGQNYGQVITREQVSFIVPGQTTRAEVVAKLGDQFRCNGIERSLGLLRRDGCAQRCDADGLADVDDPRVDRDSLAQLH